VTDTLTRPVEPDTAPKDLVLGTSLYELDESDFEPVTPAVAPKPIKRFELIDPNRRSFVIFCLVLFIGILSASILWSFNAIVEMSAWMAPSPYLRWLPAVFLDMAIIGYSFSLSAFKSRGKAGKKNLWRTYLGLAVSTGFSVIANGAHTINFWHGDITTYQAIIGVALSGVIPLLALWATEEIVRLAFTDPDDGEPRKPRFSRHAAK
jgi:hypothetical protein